MTISRVGKLYISNFLTGLVFWYGIEKLFMLRIGIDAVGIGAATALILGFNLVFDIPAGILADKWSRKGMLIISALALAASSLICGISTGLVLYLVGYVFYGIYVVASNGTYQAIIYDVLHEENRAHQYSKIMGRAYALFLSAGVGNILGGILAGRFGYRLDYFVSVVPCLLNILVILSLTEPRFHKAEQKERILRQIGAATGAIARTRLLRGLAIVWSVFAVVDMFKGEFGQLYMLRYVTGPEAIGLLWAAYSVVWALGSTLAHRFRARLNGLIWLCVLPLIIMALWDSPWSLALFMIQAAASGAATNLIDTRVQEATPSAVRASVTSVLSSLGRAAAIPASFVVGWLARDYNSLWALRFIAALAAVTLVYWLIVNRKVSREVGAQG